MERADFLFTELHAFLQSQTDKGLPIHAGQPSMLINADPDRPGKYYAALCTHLQYGNSPEEALEALLNFLKGVQSAEASKDQRPEEGAPGPEQS